MKKRSAANSQPPEPPRYFIDRSLGGIQVATALRAQGRDVVVHDARFPPDAKDEVWLRWAGENGRVVLTADDRIRYRENERAALLESGVYAFVLVSRVDGPGMAKAFVAALPKIERMVARNAPPLIGRVTASGTVEIVARGSESPRQHRP